MYFAKDTVIFSILEPLLHHPMLTRFPLFLWPCEKIGAITDQEISRTVRYDS